MELHLAATVAFFVLGLTPVVAAVFTSQIAGAWLEHVSCSGRPLLSPKLSAESAVSAAPESDQTA